ncbi:MAG: hypothetical protein KY397_04185 [Gemmatimonadetes bacterium]|nr:hypothetical protein [Gemmatimonadota bacterium]
MSDDDQSREDVRPFPFEGLHVYQRAQEAWALARAAGEAGPFAVAVEREIRAAALGIARATARSRANGAFGTELEEARGAIHAAAALLEQAQRAGDTVDETLRALLHDGSRMLGALIRSLGQSRAEAIEEEVAA